MIVLLLLTVFAVGAALFVGLRREIRAAATARSTGPTQPPLADHEHLLRIAAYYPVDPRHRYGHGLPPAPRIKAALDAGLPRYRATLESFRPLIPELREVPRDPQPAHPEEPAWVNDFLAGLDAIALYGMVATRKPPLLFEIGSGNSTKFAARARQRHSPQTRIVSLDPNPRVEIDALCDRIIRQPLESADLAVFRDLTAADILFFDGSHRILQNSDVAVFFLEVLPELPSGITLHIHDVFWPSDYPPDWATRYYSEQYMAALLLLFAEQHFEVLLPSYYLWSCTELLTLFDPIWTAPHLAGIERHGSSLWLRKR